MEKMSRPHRGRTLRATDVNFSLKLSLGVLLAAGEISVQTLSDEALAEHTDDILAVASKVRLSQSVPMNLRLSGLGELGINTLRLVDPTYKPTLKGADFGRYQMKFPSRVTLRTAGGEEYQAEVDAPVGAPGRPLEETDQAVRQKFLSSARASIPDPEAALEAILKIDQATDVREIVSLLMSR
jgi:2-methylcitrate dehydratase PrpD